MKYVNMITAAATMMLLFTLPASAGSRYRHGDAYTDYANVISSEPLYRTVRIETPERECWDEPVTVYHEVDGYRSMTPMILGGIGGAAIGHEFGHGRGRHIGAVAGGILGASVARDLQHNYRSRQGTYTTTHYETRCETRSSWREEERLDGYQVKYKYNGRVYHTTMDHDPGKQFRVNVNVMPAE
jgi:uncharacterized protein YcfJ